MATTEEKLAAQTSEERTDSPNDSGHGDGVIVVNASGHKQELDRNFSLLSLASLGLVTGSEWPTLGGSILVAIYNGSSPGVLYEFLAASFFYVFIYASLAELASAIPSAASVYHWASVGAGPRYGKACGFFAGWWNFLGWVVGTAAVAAISSNIIVAMWGIMHDSYVFQRWHVFVVYLILNWMCVSLVAFWNRALPTVNLLGLIFILGGFVATLLVLVIMPSTTGSGYATSSFVWEEWINFTGYSSDGFAFLAGMLNGAFAVGAADATCHLSEELPNPRVNVPKAMAAQIITGTITAFAYAVALFYTINDLDAVLQKTAGIPFPLAVIYQQATSSKAGAVGLLFVTLGSVTCTLIGVYTVAGRMLFTLARDNATPAPQFLERVSPRFKNPLHATLVCAVLATLLGCIYVGSLTAFNAFIGSAIVLFCLSFIAAILPNLLTRRRYIAPGPFALRGVWATLVPGIACAYIVVFNVIFCFPYALPVSAATMNYTVVITGGFTVFIGLWYLWKRNRGYEGPLIMREEIARQLAAASETKHGEIILEAELR